MPVAITLNLGSVDGESRTPTDKVKSEGGGAAPMDVLSWSWGMTQSASAHVSTGASVGSADVHDLTITKFVDRASPNLMANCYAGKDHKMAVLAVWKTMGAVKEAIPFIKISMGGTVYISSYNTGAQGDNDRFIETVSFNFSTVQLTYTPQKADQKPDGEVLSGLIDISTKFG